MTVPDGTPNGVRVVLADDHGPFRRNVAEMLSLAGDIEVVAEANDHEGAVAAASEHAPDVVLLDLEMPGDVGADGSLRRMLSLPSPPSVVVLTMHDEPGMIRRFLSRGAVGYFPKSAEMGELVEAVREAARARPSDVKGDRWAAGDGEMARRIRGHDWAQTPLGPIGEWPESLRSTVDLMLGSEAIMVVPWGPEAILLYNDAYARLIGPRGPTALGRPVFGTLPELRPVEMLGGDTRVESAPGTGTRVVVRVPLNGRRP